MVRKVEGISKLIPVVIDDCEVPESLKATVWQKIKDLENYETEFQRIIASVYEHKPKPELGSPPEYTRTTVDALLGYDEVPKPFVYRSVQFVTVEEVLRWMEEQPTFDEKAFSA